MRIELVLLCFKFIFCILLLKLFFEYSKYYPSLKIKVGNKFIKISNIRCVFYAFVYFIAFVLKHHLCEIDIHTAFYPPINFPMKRTNIKAPDSPNVKTTVATLLAIPFQSFTPEKPMSPKKNVVTVK